MKLRTLVESKESLQRLYLEKLPAKAAISLLVFIEEANKHLNTFEQVRIKKVKEYGSQVEGTEDFVVANDNMAIFLKEVEDALDEEVSILVPEMHVDDLGPITISPNDLKILSWLIKV